MAVQYLVKYKKNIAIDMRKRGLSYSEIEKRLSVPKSTLSFWLKKIKLDDEQAKVLRERGLEKLRTATEERSIRNFEAIRDIQVSSARQIGNISKRELWLIGIMLYWRERFSGDRESDLRNGIRFSSSDTSLIQLFLKWLKEVGKIQDSEMIFDIFLREGQDKEKAIVYWARVTDSSRSDFKHFYLQKGRRKSNPQAKHKRKAVKKHDFGFLRIRVKASSMLARQMSGWIKGIQKTLLA